MSQTQPRRSRGDLKGAFEVAIERIALVQANGDVVDTLMLRFTNGSGGPVVFPRHIRFDYTDSEVWVERVSYGGQQEPEKWGMYPDEARQSLLIWARGSIEAHGSQYVAARVRKRGVAQVARDTITLSDPVLDLPFKGLPVRSVTAAVTFVFPRDHARRRIEAYGAATTSRTARWEFQLGGRQPKALQAQQGTECLRTAPQALDDQIADCYERLACVLVGERPGSERPLRKKVAKLLSIREGTLAQHPFPRSSKTVVERATALTRNVLADVENGGVAAPVPQDFWEQSVALLQFQASQRRTPEQWPRSVPEKLFHKRVHQFLVARDGEVDTEVQIAAGRVDFVLGALPVELKVRKLGVDVARAIGNHLQQAAEYAASSDSATAFLLILDTSKPRGRHAPPAAAQQAVCRVASRHGAAGANDTLVVTLVVPARLPKPSRLRR